MILFCVCFSYNIQSQSCSSRWCDSCVLQRYPRRRHEGKGCSYQSHVYWSLVVCVSWWFCDNPKGLNCVMWWQMGSPDCCTVSKASEAAVHISYTGKIWICFTASICNEATKPCTLATVMLCDTLWLHNAMTSSAWSLLHTKEASWLLIPNFIVSRGFILREAHHPTILVAKVQQSLSVDILVLFVIFSGHKGGRKQFQKSVKQEQSS